MKLEDILTATEITQIQAIKPVLLAVLRKIVSRMEGPVAIPGYPIQLRYKSRVDRHKGIKKFFE